MPIILIFGDSITWGANDWEKGGWAERLKVFIGQNYGTHVYNLGVSGEKTPNLLERFQTETKARVDEGEEAMFIFAIGINDSYFVHTKGDFMIPLGDFAKNIKKLIDLAGKFSQKIIFLGLTPVDETKTDPIPWDTIKSYKNQYIEEYNEAIRTICTENKISFIDIFDDWLKTNYKSLLDDGLHPNPEGHLKIYEIVKDFLVEWNNLK